MSVIFFPPHKYLSKIGFRKFKQKDKKHVGMEMKINKPILHEKKVEESPNAHILVPKIEIKTLIKAPAILQAEW